MPLIRIVSFVRPVIFNLSVGLIKARSPVMNQPSFVNDSVVALALLKYSLNMIGAETSRPSIPFSSTGSPSSFVILMLIPGIQLPRRQIRFSIRHHKKDNYDCRLIQHKFRLFQILVG